MKSRQSGLESESPFHTALCGPVTLLLRLAVLREGKGVGTCSDGNDHLQLGLSALLSLFLLSAAGCDSPDYAGWI